MWAAWCVDILSDNNIHEVQDKVPDPIIAMVWMLPVILIVVLNRLAAHA